MQLSTESTNQTKYEYKRLNNLKEKIEMITKKDELKYKENELLTNEHIFICIDEQLKDLTEDKLKELEYIKDNFCGLVITEFENISDLLSYGTIVYVCGDIELNIHELILNEYGSGVNGYSIRIVKELSYNYLPEDDNFNRIGYIGLVSIGEIPINIYDVGVFFRNYFDSEDDYFNQISNEHEFQNLTESNKPSNAFRTGVYMTNVKEHEDGGVQFNLLRCSSNFSGGTDNFRDTDNKIIKDVSYATSRFFSRDVEMNHVLAQIYHNNISEETQTEKKAKIKQHSDKTKDMSNYGLMAFCSFYENYQNNTFKDMKTKQFNKSNTDMFDYCYRNTSVLTKLRFKLKPDVKDDKLVKRFDITLYPNSVFIMNLKTNRLYTHEIVPSILPIEKLPTRMGYVVRCSKTKALHKDGETFILENKYNIDKNKTHNIICNIKKTKMVEPDREGVAKLKQLYMLENSTSQKVIYDKFYFSLNKGDYQKPNI